MGSIRDMEIENRKCEKIMTSGMVNFDHASSVSHRIVYLKPTFVHGCISRQAVTASSQSVKAQADSSKALDAHTHSCPASK